MQITLNEFFAIYLEKHAKIHKKSWWFDEEQYNLHIKKVFGSQKLSNITREKIQNFHSKLGANSGHTCANRVLDAVSSIFGRAIEWNIFNKENPVRNIRRFKLKSRDRFLQADELPRFFKALSEEQNVIARDYIYIALLTGARKSNVLAMRWEQIRFESKEWRIPETKNGEPLIIPLLDSAIEILKSRKEANKAINKLNPFIFPGTGKTGHLADPRKAWKRILANAQIENLRIHDLRRTLGSWQAATGANSYIIGKSLGHKSQQATAIYARLNIDPVRESVDKATEAMFKAANLGNK